MASLPSPLHFSSSPCRRRFAVPYRPAPLRHGVEVHYNWVGSVAGSWQMDENWGLAGPSIDSKFPSSKDSLLPLEFAYSRGPPFLSRN